MLDRKYIFLRVGMRGEKMRVIAGALRGRRLETPRGADTRPTLDRVKEGAFSAVQFWLPGARVLDLFAGGGQLGIEALSRGAKSCVFVENAPGAATVLRQNLNNLGIAAQARVAMADAAAFLAACGDVFDLILADPPYRKGLLPELLARVAGVCAPGALALCECEVGAALPEQCGGLCLEKCYRYGAVQVARYKMSE